MLHGNIAACYNTGEVTGNAMAKTPKIGALVGYNTGTVKNSFYKTDYGNTTAETQFSADNWPSTLTAGWANKPDEWNEEYWGQWINPWHLTLGGWNSGSPDYPRLKNLDPAP